MSANCKKCTKNKNEKDVALVLKELSVQYGRQTDSELCNTMSAIPEGRLKRSQNREMLTWRDLGRG